MSHLVICKVDVTQATSSRGRQTSSLRVSEDNHNSIIAHLSGKRAPEEALESSSSEEEEGVETEEEEEEDTDEEMTPIDDC